MQLHCLPLRQLLHCRFLLHGVLMYKHEFRYRAGIFGASPYWYCPCLRWRVEAVPRANRVSGNNEQEAYQSWHTHLENPLPQEVNQ